MISITAYREHDTTYQRLLFIVAMEDDNHNFAEIRLFPDEIEQFSLTEFLEAIKAKAEIEIKRLKDKDYGN